MAWLQLTYGPHPLHTADLHLPTPQSPDARPPPVIVFVHGGAWRSEDKSDHVALAQRLAAKTHCAVAVPNYRLSAGDTEPLHHPAHAPQYDPTRLVLVGHSCSAHMIAAIVLDSNAHTPALAPPPPLRAAIKAVVLSEGIYDLERLLRAFPSYRAWFVAPAFGAGPLDRFDVSKYPLRAGRGAPWLIVHSAGDTLIDQAQSEVMYDHLRAIHAGDAEALVHKSLGVLTAEHDEILQGDAYVQIVADFVAASLE
ncbi:alpha/beta-hydrolase [Athelia psychrophila]|uniref:Alpha/beta-hydrolase n=1 Tax=Athelia psychrophila TaxID=1759441 RepID=A0A166N9A2_9AGAM|nr:alpha/beta-hydrolase [Fibularhizoctonia sp. CBS 109695]